MSIFSEDGAVCDGCILPQGKKAFKPTSDDSDHCIRKFVGDQEMDSSTISTAENRMLLLLLLLLLLLFLLLLLMMMMMVNDVEWIC